MTSRPDPDLIASSAITAAHLRGCTCTPEVTITETTPGIFTADVRHDPTCPLLTRQAAPWN